jgi:subfamily B ATP-binding cassette protein MsbA
MQVTISQSQAALERIYEILTISPTIINKLNAVKNYKIRGTITFKCVDFSYCDTFVLNNLNLNIPESSSVAFTGPSGSGKSTLVSLIPRFYDVHSGEIFIDDFNINDFDIQHLREQIAIVPQESFLFSGTVYENILIGNPTATLNDVITASKLAFIHDSITQLSSGYETLVGERGSFLSGGQKQRIALARAFLRNPRILILDEATSALDPISDEYISLALQKLKVGRTTITIAHKLSSILDVDMIFFIDDGIIKESGTFRSLYDRKGLFYKHFNLSEISLL